MGGKHRLDQRLKLTSKLDVLASRNRDSESPATLWRSIAEPRLIFRVHNMKKYTIETEILAGDTERLPAFIRGPARDRRSSKVRKQIWAFTMRRITPLASMRPAAPELHVSEVLYADPRSGAEKNDDRASVVLMGNAYEQREHSGNAARG